MIAYLKNEELDRDKYDACILTSLQSRIYAFSWYLDIVADNWAVLVLNDYEAVMPLPWRKKFGVKYSYPPFWVQQLGVFSKESLLGPIVEEFIKAIPKSYLSIAYQFNSENKIEKSKVIQKTNYLVPLDKEYQQIRKEYRKDRKYRINQVKKKGYTIIEPKVEELLSIGKKYYDHINLPDAAFLTLEKLINHAVNSDNGFLKGVEKDGNLIGGCFFLKDAKRITYLYSSMTPEGKEEQISSLILDSVIEANAESSLILDFEGSMISGVASFYRSFGAEEERYILFKKSVF